MRQLSALFRRSPRFQFGLITIAVAISCSVLAAQQSAPARPTIKVLFIGNSYTGYNDLPEIVAGISRSKKDGPIIDGTIAAVFGKDLAFHLKEGPAVATLAKGGWDFVNIQEMSLLPGGAEKDKKWVVGDPNMVPGGYYESAREWVKRIRAVKAMPILEITWARRDNPGKMQEDLEKAVTALGQELGVRVAPAGLAWTEARWRLRTIEFHFRDGAHPSEYGSYLTACVYYATITGKDPRGAAAKIMGHPVNNDGKPDMKRTVPLVDIGAATAAELQAIAWDTYNAYHNPVQLAAITPAR